MTTRFKNTLALLLLSGLLFFSCDQDSIFSDISDGREPKDPRIKGSPTNIVYTTNYIYAASIEGSTIHRYGGGSWTTFPAPGAIGQLAAAGSNLFAITRNNTVYKMDEGGTVKATASPGSTLQSVYGATDKVFVGVGDAPPYSVVCYDADSFPPSPSIVSSVSGLLTGAVKTTGGDYYITTTSGLYKIDVSSNTVTESVSGHFMGIISVNQSIIAITHGGTLYHFATSSGLSSASQLSLGGGPYTGAMSGWSPDGTSEESLLLLGVIGSSMTRGYREVDLVAGTGAPSGGGRIPGSPPSTVEKRARYEAAIGKHAVYSILQVPQTVETNGRPVIFASTYQNGLWSLRGDQWNAEE